MASLRSIADVLDYAIAREAEAHAFYADLAEHVTKRDLQESVERFALDELRHSIRLQAIRAGETAFLDDEVGSLGIADRIAPVQPHTDMTYKELLILGMDREKSAFRIYTNLAAIARTDDCRDTLLYLAQEEARHKLRLEIEYDLVTF